jgi:hypothetical protein
VLLFSSTAGVGPGPCDPSLGGACLGVRSPVTLLGRYYERFADHAVAIARRIIFQATGRKPARERMLTY